MRKLLFTVAIAVAVFNCSSPDGFIIKGKIDGKDNEQVKLMKLQGGAWAVEDSATIANGRFVLNGMLELPELRAVVMGKQELVTQFFAEKGSIEMAVDADSVGNTKISGSSANELYEVFKDELKKLSADADALQQRFNKARMKGDEDGQNVARTEFEAMIENQKVYTKNFVKENSASAVAPFVAWWQLSEQMKSKDIDEMLANFDESIMESIYVKELQKISVDKKALEVGVVAPDFTMNNQDGEPVTLSSFRGKIVLIDFWASWCAPCRKENPNVVKLYDRYKDKGFDIIGVSLDRDKSAWLQAIENDKLTWTHVSDLKDWNNAVAKLYRVRSIPHTVLLDSEGRIVANKLRSTELEAKLAEMLN